MEALEELRIDLERRLKRRVMVAPDSVDAALALVGSAGSKVLLVVNGTAPMLGALEAAVRDVHAAPCLVINGSETELEELAEEIALDASGGRVVHVAEWRLDPDAALFGRRGAARVDEIDPEPPRTLGELPDPPSFKVKAEFVRSAVATALHRYPTPTPARLTAHLAQAHGVEVERIVVSAGGTMELLGRCLRALCDAGDEVLAKAPTYDRLGELCVRERVVLRYADDLAHTLPRTRLVYVATPNVPDSRITPVSELIRIRRALPPDRVLVVDEAWAGFTDDEDELLDALDTLAPVVVLRSMSKVDGLAALRVGYAIASEPIARLLRRFADPHAIPAVVEDVAIAALDDRPQRRLVTARITRTRARVVEALRAAGFFVTPSSTHLLLLIPPGNAGFFEDRIAELGLPVEPCPQVPRSFHATVPAEADADAFVAALTDAARS